MKELERFQKYKENFEKTFKSYQNTLKEKNLEKKVKFSEEKILITKQEIKEIGFSIFEVPKKFREEYFVNFFKENDFMKKYYLFKKDTYLKTVSYISFFGISFILGLFILLFFSTYVNGYYGFLNLFVYIFFLVYVYKRIFGYYKNKLNYSSLPGIKDKYIIFTEKKIFLDNKILNYDFEKDLSLENNDFKNLFLEDGKDFSTKNLISEIEFVEEFLSKNNQTEKNIFDLKKSFGNIKIYLEGLNKIQKSFEKEFLDENGFFDHKEIEKKFLDINFYIKHSLNEKKLILKNLEKLDKLDFIDFDKFNSWLKYNLILPLKKMKKTLQKYKENCEKLFEKNKNNSSEQVLLLNKVLELQKQTLERQIFILDEKILKLGT